jgi:hypothetical protein
MGNRGDCGQLLDQRLDDEIGAEGSRCGELGSTLGVASGGRTDASHGGKLVLGLG